MCGRFALTLPQTAVREHFQASLWPGFEREAEAIDRARYNIRPTETVPVCALDEAGDRRVRPMRWGFLPHWWKSPTESKPLINARSETIAEKPAFKKACRERRCLVPADGFYEWTTDEGSGPRPSKTPHWIQPAAGGVMAFAGVWREWRSGAEAAPIASVAIVTCAANDALRPLHHRLPVVIAPEDYALWLGEAGHGAATLMRAPAEDYYAHHAVSRAINKGGAAAPDGPELIQPASNDTETLDDARLI